MSICGTSSSPCNTAWKLLKPLASVEDAILAQKARMTFGALFLPSKNWNVHNATRSEIAAVRRLMNGHSPSRSQIRLTSFFAGGGAAQ